jgi:hypothetical protein
MDPGGVQHVVSEVSAEAAGRVEVDRPPEQAGEFALQAGEGKAGGVAGLEFDENVDVAGGAEIAAGDGAEKGEPTHVVAAAEAAQFGFRQVV